MCAPTKINCLQNHRRMNGRKEEHNKIKKKNEMLNKVFFWSRS